MDGMVQYLIHQSINVSFVILVVYLVRGLMLRKVPKKYSFMLWAVVAVRLVFPGVASPISMFNLLLTSQVESTVSQQSKESISTQENSVEKVSKDADSVDNQKSINNSKTISENKIVNVENTGASNEKQVKTTATNLIFVNVFGIVWLAGMVSYWIWNVMAFLRVKKKMNEAVRFRDNIFECEGIGSAFVMGMFQPKIYIPFHTGEEELSFILKHERYHIARKDYLTNYLSCILLSVYWFHPLVWLSYKSMIKDMEMSCDEHVLQDASAKEIVRYSEVLLSFATGKSVSPAGMLCFGENDTKERVSHILKFKKAGKCVGVVCICLIVAVSGICLTNQKPGTAAQENVEKQKEKTEVQKIDSSNNSNAEETVQTEEKKDKNQKMIEEQTTQDKEQEYVYFSVEDGGDIGQLGVEGYYYSEKSKANQAEIETVAYETTADLNHDGIEDLVQITCFSTEEEPDIEKEAAGNGTFYVKVYCGLQNAGYEQQARFISCEWNASHAQNGEIFLTNKDGKDYLLFGQMYEMQGSATYGYGAVFLDDEKGIRIAEEYWDTFEMDDSDTLKGKLSKLKKKISPWIQQSSILVVEDWSREYYYCSQENKERRAAEYYDLFW